MIKFLFVSICDLRIHPPLDLQSLPKTNSEY